ncbi:MAG: hypothetical protein AB2693_17580 [Candidatus Thiodiazotropha sp.]
MTDYVCWLCNRKEAQKRDLKNHVISVHERLKVVCAWCDAKEITFRKAVDLKTHVKSQHKSVYHDAPRDCFGEPGSFWLSKFPKDYIKLVKPTSWNSPEGKFLRKAVERWCPTVRGKTARTIRDWRDGWSSLPLLSPSPSPSLDFEEEQQPQRPLNVTLHELTIDSTRIRALIYEELFSTLTWYEVIVNPSIMTEPRMMTSLLRRMEQVQQFQGTVPEIFDKELDGERLRIARSRMSGVLAIDTKFVQKVCKKEASGYFAAREDTEPARKRRKNDQSNDIPLPPKPSAAVADRLETSDMPGPEEPVMKPNDEIKTEGNKSAPPPELVEVESPLKNSAQLCGNESSCQAIPPPMANHKPAVNLETHSLSNKQNAATAIDLTVSKIPSPSLPTHQDLNFDDDSADPVVPSASVTTLLPISSPLIAPPRTTSLQGVNTLDGTCLPQKRNTCNKRIPISNQLSSVSFASETETIDERGDHIVPEEYSVNASVTSSCATYSPTPKDRLVLELPLDLRMRAEKLLRFGSMPLLPPARRNWAVDETIILPAYSPIPRWPPKGWTSYTSDVKLLLWETVSTAMALHDGIDIDRGEILDAYNFLALPGSGTPQLKSTMQTARYCNFQMLRDIYVGKSGNIELSRRVVTMLEAAKSMSLPTVTPSVILEQIEKKYINIRV